jgi:ankyrin repeat protein
MTTILEALKDNDLTEAEQLINLGHPINEQDNMGLTPLHVAVLKRNIEIVHRLLEAGATPDVRTTVDDLDCPLDDECLDKETLAEELICKLQKLGNKTPLHIAAKEGLDDIAKVLLAYGADSNIVDSGLCTPLHWAAVRGNLTFTTLLLENQACPNAKDLALSTPLHEAVRNEHIDVINLLLKYNANPLLEDVTGVTAMDLAENNMEALDLLSKKPSKTRKIKTVH